jgi:hypothetical protein
MEKWRSARLSFSSLLLAGFACATILSVASFAQSDPPLNFGNNYFVTGDYVVAGAYFMNVNVANGYATGTITIPDVNPGITGAKFVPAGAEVVAAVLYWQTVEKTGTIPGQPGSGQNGFFRPVFIGGPKTGYPITGVNLGSDNTVTWSSGGCTAPSTGNNTRTYRANVLGALPRDASGNISANGIYEIRLPSVGNNTPLTLGASLVLIYRILSPSVPLNSIVIYDGAFGQNSASLIMTQTVQGFYDAAHNPVSRLTHIVGAGKSNKFQTVYLNSAQLPPLYGSSEPAFPGWYGTWDNPTWTFGNPNVPSIANPVQAGEASATTEVVPNSSQEGCVSWGAVIVSTTVQNSDGDGLLDVWKKKPPSYPNPGYCDAAVNNGVCTPGSSSWVDLPGAAPGQKDVFVQLDYMCSSVTGTDSCTTGDGVNYSFDPRPSGAVGMVTGMFAAPAHNVNVYVNPPGTNQPDVHAIQETTCTDNLTSPPALCAFPVQPGVVAWKGGFDFFKNQLVDPTGAVNDCAVSSPPADCIPRFQPGKRYSWHYVLFAHAVGQPKWRLQDGTLRSVAQSGNAVTFTTSTPIGTLDMLTYQGITTADPYCPNGRVTIVGAATSPNLDGTYCVNSPFNSAGTSFTITVGGSSTTASYTFLTDPNLAVAVGQVNTTSGRSDVGGGDSLITLGLWGNPASPTSDGQKEPVIAGTLAHEFGHANGLTHGGFNFNSLTQFNQNYTPTILPNCAPNHQSVMSYSFQVDLLNNGSGTNVPDYSGQKLNTLNKSSSVTSNPFTTTPTYLSTSWYVPWSGVGTPATLHCDGTPITNAALMSRMTGPTASLSWSAGQDINFDGNTSESLPGFNDWANIDFRQIGATGSNSVLNGAGGQFNGGGGQFNGGGGQFNGGGGQFNGGGGQFNGGGGQFNGGGGQFNGGGEIDVATVNSITRSPQGLTVSEGVSPRTIALNWTAPTFGQIGEYKVYRSAAGGAFAVVATVTGAPPVTTYTDTVNCNPGGYSYFVTAVLAGTTQESVGSNTVSTSSGEPLTGCYTNTAKGSVALTNLAFTDLSSQNTPVQGDNIQITWSLNTDDTGVSVTRAAASSALVAIGPIPSDATCSSLAKPPEYLGYSGTYPYPVTTLSTSGSGITGTGTPFAFTWNTTTANAGCYFFELDLDSHQYEQSTALELLIYVSDSAPHVTTTALPNGVVGSVYSNTLYEAGGVSPFTWSYTGSLPSGITLGASTGTVSGTTCVAGNYSFTAKVTDKNSNYGTQGLTLLINQANTTTGVMSNANPSVFQQMVTFTVTVTPQYSCTPTGTVTLFDGGSPIASNLPLSSGMATFTTSALSVGVHSITANYSGDANFNSSNSGVWSQTVNPAPTQIVVNSVSPPTAFVGQPITVSYTFSVVAPGAGSPIPPSGNITVSASGGAGSSACMAAAVQGAGMCTLSPPPTTAGMNTYTITYAGDGNFVSSGANGNYTVYQLVFTTQPSNTGVGFTITPAVVVTAEDSGNNTLTTFTGGITLAIGSGPGTLSGTTTQTAVSGVATFGDLSINQIATADTLTASPAGGVPAATSSAFNIDTFYVDGNGNFGTLDLPTGVVTQIGAGTVPGNTGLDLTPSLQVYEYNTSNELMQITPSTGAATVVGTGSLPDPANTTTGGLTGGSYFGIDMVTGNLWSISLAPPVTTTSLGATSTALVPAGCAFDTSLAGSATVLYYTIGSTGGGSCTAFTDTLYQINPTNGATTPGVQVTIYGSNGSGVNEFVGSTFVGGVLYGFTSGGQEYTINPATGVATFVTNTTVLIFGAGDSN